MLPAWIDEWKKIWLPTYTIQIAFTLLRQILSKKAIKINEKSHFAVKKPFERGPGNVLRRSTIDNFENIFG